MLSTAHLATCLSELAWGDRHAGCALLQGCLASMDVLCNTRTTGHFALDVGAHATLIRRCEWWGFCRERSSMTWGWTSFWEEQAVPHQPPPAALLQGMRRRPPHPHHLIRLQATWRVSGCMTKLAARPLFLRRSLPKMAVLLNPENQSRFAVAKMAMRPSVDC